MLVPKEITVSQTQLKFGSNLSLSKAATRENTIDKTTDKTADSDLEEDDDDARQRRFKQQAFAALQVLVVQGCFFPLFEGGVVIMSLVCSKRPKLRSASWRSRPSC